MRDVRKRMAYANAAMFNNWRLSAMALRIRDNSWAAAPPETVPRKAVESTRICERLNCE
jgi:hypothetical protein